MSRFITACLLALFALAPIGCQQTAQRGRPDLTITDTTTSTPLVGRPMLGMPISLHLTGHTTQPNVVMVPFAIESRKSLFADKDPYTRGGREASPMYSVGSMPARAVRWHNVLFRDTKTSEEWMLLGKRGIVSRYDLHGIATETPSGGVWLGVYVTFMVTSEDTNRDGQLNDLDEREVIVCDQDGRNPRVVTPQGTQCWDLRYDGRGTIYMLLVSDTDGDGRFTDADESTPYFYNAKTTPNGAQPVISAGIAQRADALLTSGERRTGNRVTPIR